MSSPGRTSLSSCARTYDTAEGTPGADDNASGVAVLLFLAERMRATGPTTARSRGSACLP